MLPDDVSQARHGKLINGAVGIIDGNHGFRRVFDSIPKDGVDFNGHTVARDRFLLLRRNRPRADINGYRSLKPQWDEKIQSRAAQSHETAEAKNDTPFIFLRDAHSPTEQDKHSHKTKRQKKNQSGHKGNWLKVSCQR